MICFPDKPIPVMTPLGGGYVIYVKDNGMGENDEVCIALLDGGQWRHFLTNDICSWYNATYSIIKSKTNEHASNP